MLARQGCLRSLGEQLLGCQGMPRSSTACVTGRSWVLSGAVGGAPGLGGEGWEAGPEEADVLDPQLAWGAQHTAKHPLGQRRPAPKFQATWLGPVLPARSHSLRPPGLPEPRLCSQFSSPSGDGLGGAVQRMLR